MTKRSPYTRSRPWLYVLLLVVLLSVPYMASAERSTSPQASANSLDDTSTNSTVSLTDFGAVGDGVTDSGPALGAALNALAAAGGGTLYVPPGTYAIATPVTKDFSGLASAITIQGEPSTTVLDVAGNGTGLDLTSEFVIKVGQTNNALTIKNLASLLITDVIFLGVQETLNDAHIVLALDSVADAKIEHSEFYGLASLTAGGNLIHAHNSGLKINQTAFLGCSTNSGTTGSIVQNTLWQRFSITNTKFVDYGHRPDFYGKTPLAAPYSWISLGNAAALNAETSRREAFIENVFCDEGAYIGISARPGYFAPTSAPIEVFISRLRMNVNNLLSVGMYMDGIRRVMVERSRFGWSHNASGAMSFNNGGEVILDQVECTAHAHTIIADSSIQLTVINSIYETLQSDPAKTRVIVTGNPLDDPVQYVRQQFLDELGRDPDAAAYFYWVGRLLNCQGTCPGQIHQALATYLAGNPQPKFQIMGRVTNETGGALSQVNVQLSGSQNTSTTTDVAGNFSFLNLATSGQYTITPSKPHYNFQPRSFLEKTANQVADFSGVLQRYTIQGLVRTPTGIPIQGATLTLSGVVSATTTTNANGNFAFANMPGGGDFTLTVSRHNYDFPGNSATITNLSADENLVFAGTLLGYWISGKISDGQNGAGGVEVRTTGTETLTTTTDAAGNYSIGVAPGGNYTVTPSAAHYLFTPASAQFTNVAAPQVANFQRIATDTVEFNNSSYQVSEGVPSVSVTVMRKGDTSAPASVRYSMVDGTATQDRDYILATGLLQFAPNETTKTFSVIIIDDGWVESAPETAALTLSDPEGLVLGQQNQATLTIVDNNNSPLPNINPIENLNSFVRQQYGDFLARQPDGDGLAYWMNQITACGSDQGCIASRRVGVSASFFVESEFQQTGGFVVRLFHASLGRRPQYSEFMSDRGYLISFIDLEMAKQRLAEDFVRREAFRSQFSEDLTPEQFVNQLIAAVLANTGIDLAPHRETLLDDYLANQNRGRILRLVAEVEELRQSEFNYSFVLMQYFGYLRRDPDQGGFDFWLNILNNRQPGNFRGMVCAFLTSREYQERFGPAVPRTDLECASIQ